MVVVTIVCTRWNFVKNTCLLSALLASFWAQVWSSGHLFLSIPTCTCVSRLNTVNPSPCRWTKNIYTSGKDCNCKFLGVMLKIQLTTNSLSTIACKYPQLSEDCLIEILQQWLSRIITSSSWSIIFGLCMPKENWKLVMTVLTYP